MSKLLNYYSYIFYYRFWKTHL